MVARLAAPLAVGMTLLAAAAVGAEKRLDRTFDVQPGGTLRVEADGADIRVTGTDSSRVVVRIVATGPERMLELLTLSAQQHGNGVEVVAKRRSDGWLSLFNGGWHEGAQITIEVPRAYNVDLRTSGGDMSVAGLKGTASGKTSGGDIELADISGPVRMQTSGGDIHIERIDGDTQASTSGGDIEGTSLTGDLDLKTSGGAIELAKLNGNLSARTSSGNVIVQDARGDVDLKSSGGDIRAERIDGRIVAYTSGGDVSAELLGANRGVSVTTSGGNIELRLPKNVSATVDASSSGGSVRSELPVATMQARERRLQGTINGGGETIHARTSGGSVRLLQAPR